VVFKREKEVSRSLEFDGMWIAEQPSDDDIRGHWDKLVISTRCFPDKYWDKFVKKKVAIMFLFKFTVSSRRGEVMGPVYSGKRFRQERKTRGLIPSLGFLTKMRYINPLLLLLF